MRINKIQKIIIGFLIFGQTVLMPGLALAFASTATGAVNPVPINDTGSVVANTAFDAAFTPIKTAYAGCRSAIAGFEGGDNVARLGFSFSSLVGGGGAYAAQLGKEIVAYNLFLNPPCLSDLIPALDALTAPNIYTATLKQQMLTQMKADAQTYQAKLKTAHERFNAANESIWKALLITVLISTTKSVANQLVSKLVNNYKIANVKAYVDSLATLAYDNQYIRQNFPDTENQLIARSILTNPLFRTNVPPAVFAVANKNLGFVPMDLKTDDPYFYSKMATAGFATADPYFLHTNYYVPGVDQSRANSLATAQAHIAQGNGYKAPVNCAGSLAQQKATDLQAKALLDKLNDRQALYNNLKQAQDSGQKVQATDLAKAQADLTLASNAWNSAPDALGKDNAALIMCEAVASPAVLVNQGIDAMFKAVGANISQYNSNNLPGFLSAIGGIASQIGSSMILGGITGNSSTVNEKQAITQAVIATQNATVQTLNNNAAENLAKGINFLAEVNVSTPNTYSLNWQIDTDRIPSAKYVTITGNGITGVATQLPLSGATSVTTTTGGNYTLTVYTLTNGKSVSLVSAVITITVSQQAYNSPSGPAVAGAFTSRTPLAIRGQQEVLYIRGE